MHSHFSGWALFRQIHRQVQNHNAEQIHEEESDEDFRQLINAKRQGINFPPARTEDRWEATDSKVLIQLDKHSQLLSTFHNIVYQTCLNTFGAKEY